MFKFSLKLFLLLILSGWYLLPVNLLAVSLDWLPVQVNLAPGEEFEVNLWLDPQDESVNALAGELAYTVDSLILKEIRTADSVINFWLEPPKLNTDGKITFSGIIPGGFNGVLSPFYSGVRPGKVLSLIFLAKQEGRAVINWSTSEALLNDGAGTTATLVSNSLPVQIKSDLINNAPTIDLPPDNTSPELFVPEIARDPSLFNGQWFVTFATRDLGRGVARYEVSEHSSPLINSHRWREVVSPYLLRDQSLKSYVSVRVTDYAGNERVVTLKPQNISTQYTYAKRTFYSIIIVLIALLFILWLKKKNLAAPLSG